MGETISFDIIARDLASRAFKDAGGAAEGFHGKLALVSGIIGGAVATSLVHMGEKLEESRATLKQTIADTGGSWGQFSEQIDKAVSHEEKFGHSSSDTNAALAVLTRATGDTKKSLEDMSLVTEIAAAHHSSLAEAAGTVAKMHAGAFRALKEFGINTKDAAKAVAETTLAEKNWTAADNAATAAKQKLADLLDVQHHKAKLTEADHIALRNAQTKVTETTLNYKTATERLDAAHASNAKSMDFATAKAQILAKIHGTAEAQANTFGGKIKGLETKFKDYAAELGAHVGPALMIVGPLLSGVGAIISAEVVPSILAATAAALPWIAGLAAVAAAGYVLYRNWDTIWGFIKDTTSTVVGFITDHLTLILTVALGPLGLAIAVLKDHWSAIWNAISTAVGAAKNLIVNHINLILAIGLGPLGIAIDILKEHWAAIWNFIQVAVGAAWDLMKPVFGFIVNFGIAYIRFEIQVLRDVWNAAWAVIHGAISTAWNILRPVVGFIVNLGIHVIRDEINVLRDVWNDAWGGLHAAVETMWRIVQPILDQIKRAVNDLLGPLGKIGGALGKVGGFVGGAAGAASGFLGFADGGYVPGSAGQPQLAVVHGGELVLNPEQQKQMRVGSASTVRGMGGNVYQITLQALDSRSAGDVVIAAIKSFEQTNGAAWRSA